MALGHVRILLVVILFAIATSISAQGFVETLIIDWPSDYNWKPASSSDHDGIVITRFVPEGESEQAWTSFGSIMTLQGLKSPSLLNEMHGTEAHAKEVDSASTLTLIERDSLSSPQWLLFKVEMPRTSRDTLPESRLCYLVQGNQSLFLAMVVLRVPTLSAQFLERWIPVFKSSHLVYK